MSLVYFENNVFVLWQRLVRVFIFWLKPDEIIKKRKRAKARSY